MQPRVLEEARAAALQDVLCDKRDVFTALLAAFANDPHDPATEIFKTEQVNLDCAVRLMEKHRERLCRLRRQPPDDAPFRVGTGAATTENDEALREPRPGSDTLLFGARRLVRAPWRWRQTLPSASASSSSSSSSEPSIQQLGRMAASALWRSKGVLMPGRAPASALGFVRGGFAHP